MHWWVCPLLQPPTHQTHLRTPMPCPPALCQCTYPTHPSGSHFAFTVGPPPQILCPRPARAFYEAVPGGDQRTRRQVRAAKVRRARAPCLPRGAHIRAINQGHAVDAGGSQPGHPTVHQAVLPRAYGRSGLHLKLRMSAPLNSNAQQASTIIDIARLIQ